MLVLKKQNPTALKSADRKSPMQRQIIPNHKQEYSSQRAMQRKNSKEYTAYWVVDIGKLIYIISELKRSKSVSSEDSLTSHYLID